MISSGLEYDQLRETNGNTFQEPLQLSEELTELFKIVSRNLLNAYNRYSRPYNLRANKSHSFKKGEEVYKKNVHMSDKGRDFVGKFAKKFTKVRIRDVLGTNSYILENLEGKRVPGVRISTTCR